MNEEFSDLTLHLVPGLKKGHSFRFSHRAFKILESIRIIMNKKIWYRKETDQKCIFQNMGSII